jgi:hypothetical protein
LEIPLRKNIELFFMEIFVSSTRTYVEGGRWKNVAKGKGKLKEKVTKPPSFDANQKTFVEVSLN